MLTMANGQFKYKIVTSSFAHIHVHVASKLYTLVEKYKGGIIPMQELDSQRGEGAYFQRRLIFREIQYYTFTLIHACFTYQVHL